MSHAFPGSASPAAGFDQPFELLAGCHERVRRSLALLDRLVTHVGQHGADAPARSAAHDVLRYFDIAAPLHHEDEERHLVPRLQASDDVQLRAAATQMLADHAQMRRIWASLREELQALARAASGPCAGLAALRALAVAFDEVHQGHLALEDERAFPEALRLVDANALRAMGAEMAGRRGVKPTA